MTTRRQCETSCSPAQAGWWGRLLVTVIFAFYVGYIPVHLATEAHGTDALAASGHGHVHQDAPGEADHADHGDGDQHGSHPASQHQLTLSSRTTSPSADFSFFLIPGGTAVQVCLPAPQLPLLVFERIRPPAESPPDPLQPRAPPLV